MAYRFTDARKYRFQSGSIFLGRNEHGEDIGISTERGAIACAGARSGKGQALIIPNLVRWPGSILCIDPSAENVAATWERLEAAGKTVVLLDPFHEAEQRGVPVRLRKSVNLLDGIDPNSHTVREDIRVIADGMVKRYKAEDGTWDNGAVSVLAGFIAYVMAAYPPADRVLPNVRFLLTLPDVTRRKVFEDMQDMTGMGNLARAAAAIGLSDTKKNQEFVSGAVDHSEWLDSEPMGEVLAASTFSLKQLKTEKVAVFLVLPHDFIDDHSRFLRMFVRAALNAMTRGGVGKERCLFLLDEFFSLGKIDQLETGSGALPKYGVHLFPFIQNLDQLKKLYREDGATTFLANADAAIFFGNAGDMPALQYQSLRIGPMTPDEAADSPPTASPFSPSAQPVPRPFTFKAPPTPTSYVAKDIPTIRTAWFQTDERAMELQKLPDLQRMRVWQTENARAETRHRAAEEEKMRIWQAEKAEAEAAHRAEEEARMREWQRQNVAAQERHNARQKDQHSVYDHAMRKAFSPRLTPLEIESLTGRPEGGKLARSMIVFAKASDTLNLQLRPDFLDEEERAVAARIAEDARQRAYAKAHAARYKIPRFRLKENSLEPFNDFGLLVLTNDLQDECRSDSITAETLQRMKKRIARDLAYSETQFQIGFDPPDADEIKLREFMRETAIRLHIVAIWIDHVANIMAKYDASKFRFSFYDDDHSWSFFSAKPVFDHDNVRLYVWSNEDDGMNIVEKSDLKDFIPGGREYVEKGMALVT